MTKGKVIYYYNKDTELLECDCSACEHYRDSFEAKIQRKDSSCFERFINFFKKIF